MFADHRTGRRGGGLRNRRAAGRTTARAVSDSTWRIARPSGLHSRTDGGRRCVRRHGERVSPMGTAGAGARMAPVRRLGRALARVHVQVHADPQLLRSAEPVEELRRRRSGRRGRDANRAIRRAAVLGAAARAASTHRPPCRRSCRGANEGWLARPASGSGRIAAGAVRGARDRCGRNPATAAVPRAAVHADDDQ